MIRALFSIVLGWWYYLTSNKASNNRSRPRMAICDTCVLKVKWANSCSDCGCFLPAKTRVEDAQCPKSKW